MLKSKDKKKIVEEHRTHEKDTGSAEVQVALLSKQIDELTGHLKKHSKDNHSRRGLLKMVSKRKKFLEYLSKTNKSNYEKLIKKLGLRK
ncbi:30S ribosomal protein S15 [Candidatus Giovannonibacteria bacterium RIFCSPLOWO2_01_FULL_43_160]|uniref:Small ribosomal subunit protein uS15 n=2 Tax=Candidatus Giovannoniibacteriota TaxID=1752738 RepID=A0A0G1IT94_9BACT|nr:MAG: 30S ribosomal protein S15 [Candidatus Giovannonibacteria bacterium GW2011_GWB1_43_13]KKS99045.1 MAG: 30S ribosomal protein S15 [Candidatus Giovannonibacteria bacterium GW2011_GWA1_43_15]KKT20622.1 MAG: 30S ribosomal protein S15 [Candidatus Giovannonibacteria bacterium GW2011_GWC2_43_8]KKT62375.1 MAG: 30S ribosomal protein S15 [Candidatus Giovannonibacteria bacterium GW2011_GWA2_44_26]OGF59494.1 MAG: 30S ribosomal protein S15 [Candidatus Giovannonibacteria bacterium RIFCSPHIGHO2_01_FULL_